MARARFTLSVIFALIVLLPGCATQLTARPIAGLDGADSPVSRALTFQSAAIAPARGDAPLAPEHLRPGDILLTSGSGLVSASIQLVTRAPVSHAALYIGDGQVVEALRAGVQVRSLDEFVADDRVVLAYRDPGLSETQALGIREYALSKTGAGFNFSGVTLQIPFSIKRLACEIPLVPSALRDACIRTVGLIQHLTPSESRLFCSQLVLESYKRAGAPITDADPRLVSPADILHMREGDVPSIAINRPLRHVGHLKYELASMETYEQ